MGPDAFRSLVVALPAGTRPGAEDGRAPLEASLRARGHALTFAASGAEALDALGHEPFDLALVVWGPGECAEVAGLIARALAERGGDDALPELVAAHPAPEPAREDLAAMLRAGVDDLFSIEEGEGGGASALRLELLERRARSRRRRLARTRLAAEALRKSDERFRLVAKATSDALYDWNLETNALAWSDGIRQLFGYAPEEVVQDIAWWEERLHPDDREAVEASLRAALADGREVWTGEYRFRAADGSYVPVSDRGVLLRGNAGRALRMIGAMSDLTEKKRMEGRLQLADRMASIGTLAAGMAHEINNPLTYVLSNVDLADSRLSGAEGPAVESAREALAAAREGAERVGRIVRSLKTFARAEDERRGPVDVVETLEACIQMAKGQLYGRAEVERAYAEDLPPAEADEPRLAQVFLNLLVNAAQALPATRRGRIRVGACPERGRVRIWVEDEGVGIPEEAKKRIFDPFYTSKPVGEGSGLGLSVCHAIVTSLGGELLVESEVGRGSTFTVLLPASAARPAEEGPPVPLPPLAGGPRRRVLVVDDDVRVARVIAQTLAPFHETEIVTDGRAALARLEGGARYDVILCDLMMPGLTGMDVHEALSASAPELARRVVFLTGGAFTPRAREYLDAVPNLRLEKPFDTDALLAVIRRASEPA